MSEQKLPLEYRLSELPTTLEELCDYIHHYAEMLYVRECVHGKWGVYALSELPAKAALEHALRWIKEGVIPVRVLTEEEASQAHQQQPAVDEEEEKEKEDLKLGKCCACEREDATVRAVMMLDKRSPEPGTCCWGCFQCGLPVAGAVAVLCEECIEAKRKLRFACLGPPGENRRVAIESLTEPFEHEMSKHPGGGL